MNRNIVEIVVAFAGLVTVYYSAGISHCLHPPGVSNPNCHFTPAGATIFVVGFIVGILGIAPWKLYAPNYVCRICGDQFGGGRRGKSSQSEHFKTRHSEYYRWAEKWELTGKVLFVISIVYVCVTLIVGSLFPLADWWAVGFALMIAAILLYMVDYFLVTRKFRRKMQLLQQ